MLHVYLCIVWYINTSPTFADEQSVLRKKELEIGEAGNEDVMEKNTNNMANQADNGMSAFVL